MPPRGIRSSKPFFMLYTALADGVGSADVKPEPLA